MLEVVAVPDTQLHPAVRPGRRGVQQRPGRQVTTDCQQQVRAQQLYPESAGARQHHGEHRQAGHAGHGPGRGRTQLPSPQAEKQSRIACSAGRPTNDSCRSRSGSAVAGLT